MRDEMTKEEARMMEAKKAAEQIYNQRLQTMNEVACDRQSARGAIEQRCENLLREANGLRALLRAMPQDISSAAEEALWKLVVERR